MDLKLPTIDIQNEDKESFLEIESLSDTSEMTESQKDEYKALLKKFEEQKMEYQRLSNKTPQKEVKPIAMSKSENANYMV